ncbi:MAG: hypothetical protein DRP65_00045 [Planctomycetota bacterium]|nr:MAG: hypothetical protein DRP65_00045 [Planctomycetota bacterium]
MVLEIVTLLVCLWLAIKVRRRPGAVDGRPNPWVLAKQSLRWGIVLVTVPLLGYFGVVRFMHGAGIPSAFSLVLCTGITALVMMGMEVELTGNILVDCLLVSIALVAASFTVVNGVPLVLVHLSGANLCRWVLACVAAAMLVRVWLWIIKGD